VGALACASCGAETGPGSPGAGSAPVEVRAGADEPVTILTSTAGGAASALIAHVPTALPPTSPSGSLVGTLASGSAGAASASSVSGVSIVQMQADMKASNAGSERDLRASLYFDLVDQCRDEDGGILPPEAIEIEFRVDARGTIDRSSVRATALSPEHENAARCMVRVIRTADARFAPARLDEPTRVKARVPSVD